MLKDNELIGVFTVYRQEVRPFTDKQIALVTELCRAGRYRYRERAAAQRAAPAQTISESLSSRRPPPTCFRSLAARLRSAARASDTLANRRRVCRGRRRSHLATGRRVFASWRRSEMHQSLTSPETSVRLRPIASGSGLTCLKGALSIFPTLQRHRVSIGVRVQKIGGFRTSRRAAAAAMAPDRSSPSLAPDRVPLH